MANLRNLFHHVMTNKSNIMRKKGKNFRLCVIIKYTKLKVLNA